MGGEEKGQDLRGGSMTNVRWHEDGIYYNCRKDRISRLLGSLVRSLARSTVALIYSELFPLVVAVWPIFASKVHKRWLKIHFAAAASIVALTANFRYYRIVIADRVNSAMRGGKEELSLSLSLLLQLLVYLLPSANSPSLLNYLETAAGVLSVPRARFTRAFDGEKEGNRGREKERDG